jgi:hypothetical protein
MLRSAVRARLWSIFFAPFAYLFCEGCNYITGSCAYSEVFDVSFTFDVKYSRHRCTVPIHLFSSLSQHYCSFTKIMHVLCRGRKRSRSLYSLMWGIDISCKQHATYHSRSSSHFYFAASLLFSIEQAKLTSFQNMMH